MSSAEFDAARSALATEHSIDVRPLRTAVAVEVSEQQAKDVALRQFGVPEGTSVEARLVTATDDGYATVGTDGTRALLISDRAMWLVLLPEREVPIRGTTGPPFSYAATLAVLIDAASGEFIKAAALAS